MTTSGLRHTVYATNVFHTLADGTEKVLEELVCPKAGTPIVVDMSALLTLNELGMLGQAAEYFGTILVPAQCRESTLEHLRHLVAHQPSRRHAAVAIRTAIESGLISVPDAQNDNFSGALARLSEADNPGHHAYRFTDLAVALDEEGAIGTDQLAALQRIAHSSSSVDADHPPLAAGQELLCDVSTLETLHIQGLLPVCLETFDIHLSPEDRKEVFGTEQAFESHSRLHENATRLLHTIQQDSRFVVERVPIPAEFEEVSFFDDAMAASTFAAAFAAVDKNIPLFADDRALQMFACQRQHSVDRNSFSSAAFLEALCDTDDAQMSVLGPAMLSLLNWRYRFIVPSAKFLKHFADQFRNHLPGRFLRQVAMYAHQSMNDPGVFAGFEPTTPPTSIAARLYFHWIKGFMDLVARCWLDTNYSETQARRITEWVLTEAIPTVPRNLPPHVQSILAAQTPIATLNYLALATATSDQTDRITAAMKAIREVFKISEADYLHLVTQIAT